MLACHVPFCMSYWVAMRHSSVRVQFKCDSALRRGGGGWGGVKGKLANRVCSQYSSHYLRTWCVQHTATNVTMDRTISHSQIIANQWCQTSLPTHEISQTTEDNRPRNRLWLYNWTTVGAYDLWLALGYHARN